MPPVMDIKSQENSFRTVWVGGGQSNVPRENTSTLSIPSCSSIDLSTHSANGLLQALPVQTKQMVCFCSMINRVMRLLFYVVSLALLVDDLLSSLELLDGHRLLAISLRKLVIEGIKYSQYL